MTEQQATELRYLANVVQVLFTMWLLDRFIDHVLVTSVERATAEASS